MQTIRTAELKEMKQRNKSFALVNVLPEENFVEEHIPDSQNVPVGRDDFEEAIRGITTSPEQTVVVYCASEDCDASPAAAQRLEAAGFENVYDYEAGMRGWAEAGLRVEKGK